MKKPRLEQILCYYDLWLRTEEPTHTQVAAAIGISTQSHTRRIRRWEELPEMQQARKLAIERRGWRSQTLGDYVFQRLSPEAKVTWERLRFWSEHEDADVQIKKILSGTCKKLRQEIYIHALVSSNFDPSAALRMTGLSRTAVQTWQDEDLEFRQLVEEIHWHKKNFFERALLDLVEVRNPAATIFVNKTVNADRGYTERLQVDHTFSQDFTFEDLDLDVETRRKVLEAVRKRREQIARGEGREYPRLSDRPNPLRKQLNEANRVARREREMDAEQQEVVDAEVVA